MNKVLVTGGSGTVGQQVCRLMKEHDWEPVSLIRNPARQLEKGSDVEFIVGDVKNYDDVICAMKDPDIKAVVHCAANKHISVCEKQPIECIESNILGTLNVIRAVEELQDKIVRAVFISTDKAAKRVGTYGMSKYLGEEMVRELGRRTTVRVNSVRMGNVFGSSGSVIPIWHKLVTEGKDIKLRQLHGQAPKRFAMTPWQAGDFIIDVFNKPYNFENGSVIFPACPVIDISVLADVMTENNESNIVVEDMKDAEITDESLATIGELLYLREPVIGIYEIGSTPVEQEEFLHPIISTFEKRPMSFGQTKLFYYNVIKQMGL